jgi:hypothetical protein
VTLRRDITQTVINLLPAPMDLDQAMRTWYYNLRSQGGFRLTQIGYQALCSAAVNSWSVDIQYKDITKPSLLALDRKLKWPYYIDTKRKKLVLFSSHEAMMATLYGDVRQWLEHLGSRDSVPDNL